MSSCRRLLAMGLILSAAPLEAQDDVKAYIQTLTTMVSVEESSSLGPAAAKLAIAQANQWLITHDRDVVDSSTLEIVRKNQRTLWQRESRTDGFLQALANKVGAGLSLELSAIVAQDQTAEGAWAQATVTIKGFDAATAELLASFTFQTARIFSASGAADAVQRAVPFAVAQAMPRAWDQISAKLEKNLARGIRYDVVLQATMDASSVSQLRRKLELRVKSLRTVSASVEETRWEIFFLGSADDLSDTIVKLAEAVAGMEDLYLVLLQGRSLTFRAGGDTP